MSSRRGRAAAPARDRVLLEFVSVNPTGPPHVGHARHLRRLARAPSFRRRPHPSRARRYVDDSGTGPAPLRRVGGPLRRAGGAPDQPCRRTATTATTWVRWRPRCARRSATATPTRRPTPRPTRSARRARRGPDAGGDPARPSASRTLDLFFSERDIARTGSVEAAIAELEAAGTPPLRGCAWFRSSRYSEKDRVLCAGTASRPTSRPTSRTTSTRPRAVTAAPDVLGADHHGCIARLQVVRRRRPRPSPRGAHRPVGQPPRARRGAPQRAAASSRSPTSLRRHGRRRGALLPRAAKPRQPARPRPRRRPRGEPGLLRPVRPRAGLRRPGPGRRAAATEPAAPAELDPAERALVLRLAGWPTAAAEAEQRRAPHTVTGLPDRGFWRASSSAFCQQLPGGRGGARGRGLLRLNVCRATGAD